MKKIVVIIQARMGSTRLSGKVMKDLFGKTVLAHDIERVKQAKQVDDIVIATTINFNDDIIVVEALKYGVKVFRGSEEDVLSRYYFAAKENNADIIIRITSDCPLIDPIILDEIIEFYLNNNYDIVTNAGEGVGERTYPRGLDIEIFSFEKLEETYLNAKENYQREHVSLYMLENMKTYCIKNVQDYSKYRLTLDTQEDWDLICKIYEGLYKGKHNFYMQDIIKLLDKNPEWHSINSSIVQKNNGFKGV